MKMRCVFREVGIQFFLCIGFSLYDAASAHYKRRTGLGRHVFTSMFAVLKIENPLLFKYNLGEIHASKV